MTVKEMGPSFFVGDGLFRRRYAASRLRACSA